MALRLRIREHCYKTLAAVSLVREQLPNLKVRVINVYPAATDTGIWSQVEGKWPRERMMSATQVADAVTFALARPTDTLVENITLSSLVGNL